ncbi:gas vesicle protein [Nocardioides pocheonensis]|uniref:Gas vesicle protein n=1 Tax=Nocardioides pocheonensis TaxID=661485 RepID=A0A3N0GJS4_9ACTN|nr:gas vesicle protein [Nocardioides pocheonensis]RNM12703.1 gas vesicle protein [Nocardioides pocheonensis]
MSSSSPQTTTAPGAPQGPVFSTNREPSGQSLADVLERVLDKGIVVVGDIQVRLLDIELLTIKIRLMVASVDKAKEMGISWWENDAFVTGIDEPDEKDALEQRVRELEQRLGDGEVQHGR